MGFFDDVFTNQKVRILILIYCPQLLTGSVHKGDFSSRKLCMTLEKL